MSNFTYRRARAMLSLFSSSCRHGFCKAMLKYADHSRCFALLHAWQAFPAQVPHSSRTFPAPLLLFAPFQPRPALLPRNSRTIPAQFPRNSRAIAARFLLRLV